MTAALSVAEEVFSVPVQDIVPSTIPNYRQRKGDAAKLEELAASIVAQGVLQPLVLRRGSRAELELVFGHRRLEAAKKAGRAAVPCVIRAYTDEEVRDARLIENNAREDVHPLDQAAEYAEALRRGHSPQAIAEKLGQTVRYVLQRLALNELCSAGQLALEQGFISLDVAVLIARLPGEAIQNEALRRVSADQAHAGEGVMLLEHAREEIETGVMLDLSAAPFELDDADLVPAAGPCTTCRKRTGNQAELFADATKGDLCIDPPCHRSKLDALYKLRVKQAKADGVAVVPTKNAQQVLDGAYGFGTGELVRLDGRAQIGLRDVPVRSLLGKELPPITITQDPKTGLTVEMVPRAALQVALKKAEKKKPAADPQRADAKAKREREAERMQAEVRRRVMLELVAGMERLPRDDLPELPIMRVLVRAAIHSLPPDVAKAVANRRGCPLTVEEGAATSKKGKGKRQEQLTPEQRLQALVESLGPVQIGGLLLELLLHRAAPGKWSDAHDSYVEATIAFGVDVASIGAAVKAERATKAKAKAKPEKLAPAKKPKRQRVVGLIQDAAEAEEEE